MESEECVILYRNTGNQRVGYIRDGDGDEIMVYRNYEAALRDVANIPVLRAFPYQILELDELPATHLK